MRAQRRTEVIPLTTDMGEIPTSWSRIWRIRLHGVERGSYTIKVSRIPETGQGAKQID